MILGAIADTPYKIVLLLHILTALVAFAPAFVHPLVARQMSNLDAENRSAVLNILHDNGRRIFAPALVVSGILGFGLQGMSDSVWSFSQTWMWLAAVVWVAMNGILHAVLLPAQKEMADGNTSVQQKIDVARGALLALLVIVMYLMIFKPGL